VKVDKIFFLQLMFNEQAFYEIFSFASRHQGQPAFPLTRVDADAAQCVEVGFDRVAAIAEANRGKERLCHC